MKRSKLKKVKFNENEGYNYSDESDNGRNNGLYRYPNDSMILNKKEWKLNKSIKILIYIIYLMLISKINYIYYIEMKTNFINNSLIIIGIHFICQYLLETILPNFINVKVLETGINLRHFMVNIILMVYSYVFLDFKSEWVSILFGCYVSDLLIVISKWKYIRKKYLKYILFRHFMFFCFIILIHYTIFMYIDKILLCILLYSLSNSFTLISFVFGSLKCSCNINGLITVSFIFERLLRFGIYFYGLTFINLHLYFKPNYMYVVLFLYAVLMDNIDIYFQLRLLCKKIKNIDDNDSNDNASQSDSNPNVSKIVKKNSSLELMKAKSSEFLQKIIPTKIASSNPCVIPNNINNNNNKTNNLNSNIETSISDSLGNNIVRDDEKFDSFTFNEEKGFLNKNEHEMLNEFINSSFNIENGVIPIKSNDNDISSSDN